jgi:hypothetical protein
MCTFIDTNLLNNCVSSKGWHGFWREICEHIGAPIKFQVVLVRFGVVNSVLSLLVGRPSNKSTQSRGDTSHVIVSPNRPIVKVTTHNQEIVTRGPPFCTQETWNGVICGVVGS